MPDMGLNRRWFWVAAIALIVGIGAVIWFIVPGPDTRHDLRSPGGKLLQIAEQCSDGACMRVIVYEENGVRTGCPIEIDGIMPVFIDVKATWNADESQVVLDYTDKAGEHGTLTLSPKTDCTKTD